MARSGVPGRARPGRHLVLLRRLCRQLAARLLHGARREIIPSHSQSRLACPHGSHHHVLPFCPTACRTSSCLRHSALSSFTVPVPWAQAGRASYFFATAALFCSHCLQNHHGCRRRWWAAGATRTGASASCCSRSRAARRRSWRCCSTSRAAPRCSGSSPRRRGGCCCLLALPAPRGGKGHCLSIACSMHAAGRQCPEMACAKSGAGVRLLHAAVKDQRVVCA